MRRLGITIAIVLMLGGGFFGLEDKRNPQQQALVDLAETGGYKVRKTPGYNGAWWVTVEVPGCEGQVGLRSEEAPRDHVPTRYFVVRVGSTPQEVLNSYIGDNATAATLKRLVPSEAHLNC